MYIKKSYYLRNTIEVEKRYPGNYGAPGKEREKKCKKTPEDIARQNEWNACKKLRRLINLNFGEDDYHLILTYKKEERPKDEQEAKKILQKFLRTVRREYARQRATIQIHCNN